MQETIYTFILDSLADHAPRTLGEIEGMLAARQQNTPLAQIFSAIMLLVGMGQVQPAQEETEIAAAKPRTDRLNAYIVKTSLFDNRLAFLASPVTGGGVAVDRFQQMFLLARAEGHGQPADWASFACKILMEQGVRLVKEGQALMTEEENLAAFDTPMRRFLPRSACSCCRPCRSPDEGKGAKPPMPLK